MEEIWNGSAFTEKVLPRGDPFTAEKIAAAKAKMLKENTVYRAAFLELRKELISARSGAYARVNEILHSLSGTAENTVTAAKKAITQTFQSEGVLNVTFRNGAEVDVGAYAAMVARSARTESANVANERIARELGTNLVKCIGNDITCKVCAMYRDRVFCTDGKDKCFPSLTEGANAPLRHGYKLIHPNCRCEFVPYFELLQSPEEIAKDIEKSNRPFKDDRTLAVKNAYQDWQAMNRQVREERVEFENMQAVLGDRMPYETIGGFRRAKRAESENYRNITNDLNQVISGTNAHLAGLEFRLKTIDSFKRKVFLDSADKGIDLKTAAKEINDAIRYTAISGQDTLYSDYGKIVDSFLKMGYNLIRVKNTWKDSEAVYKGINAVLEAPNRQHFELQFHTQESYDCKQGKMHEYYEEFRKVDTSKERKEQLVEKMKDLTKTLHKPQDIEKI